MEQRESVIQPGRNPVQVLRVNHTGVCVCVCVLRFCLDLIMRHDGHVQMPVIQHTSRLKECVCVWFQCKHESKVEKALVCTTHDTSHGRVGVHSFISLRWM
jgi:hypothetical protein